MNAGSSRFPPFHAGRALGEALAFAAQWRVWLLWVLALALPTWLGIAPLATALGEALDLRPDAATLAQGMTLAQAGDLMATLDDATDAISAALLASFVVALLLAPWLSGLSIVAARAVRAPKLAELIVGGLAEYPRQFRLLLWAAVPFGLVLLVFGAASAIAAEHAAVATLETSALAGERIALGIGALAFVLAHASIEAARAFIVVRPADGGALRAWWRGVKLLARRPLPAFGLYLAVVAIALVVVYAIALARIRVHAIGWPAFLGALALAQLGVAAIAWGRVARLRALSHLAHDEALRRYR